MYVLSRSIGGPGSLRRCVWQRVRSLSITADTIKSILDPTVKPLLSRLQIPESLAATTSKKDVVRSFQRSLAFHVEDFIKNEGKTPATTISAESYINPKLSEVAPLLLNLHTNPPPGLSKLFPGTSTKRDVLEKILSTLLQREVLQHNLVQTKLADNKIDFSNPAEWYPEARKMKRKFILHVGPTNSGKTYNALKLLEKANSGYYAGPLRLLAREIYEKYHQKGIRCNLVTGEEIIPDLDEYGNIAPISSGTIEMVPVNRKMDICIIDEIQMLGDNRRGEAWSNALLGVQAKELHLCGEVSAVPMIEKIAKITGDEVIINKYERLGKLEIEDEPVNLDPQTSYTSLKKGDCIVAFSKLKILKIKRDIETSSKWKVGVVYGALPPEVRSNEAAKFNSGEYDILVASDAIGMGLNLKIKRIIFADSKKFDGEEVSLLTVSQVKQIAGRAGRFLEGKEGVGYVTAVGRQNLRPIKEMMKKEPAPIKKIYIWPTPQIWSKYIASFPEYTPMVDILLNFEKEFKGEKRDKNSPVRYEITELDTRKLVLQLFQTKKIIGKLSLEDELKLSIAPINLCRASEITKNIVLQYVENIANCKSQDILKLKVNDQNIMKGEPSHLFTYERAISIVGRLEEMHKLTLLFLWLSQRWPTLFVEKEAATDLKSLIEKRIAEELANLKRIKQLRKKSYHSVKKNKKTKHR